jgi:micrococcal nuclease
MYAHKTTRCDSFLRAYALRACVSALCLFWMLAAPMAAHAEETERILQGTVVRVSDGDTMDVRVGDGSLVRVRLYGVDAPELSQTFGGEARRYAAATVLKRNVQVHQKNIDKYGRLVGQIFVDGRDLGLELLQAGMVWWYRQYCDDPRYGQAQDSAQQQRRGLWGAPGGDPQAPWEYRRAHPRRTKNSSPAYQQKKDDSGKSAKPRSPKGGKKQKKNSPRTRR